MGYCTATAPAASSAGQSDSEQLMDNDFRQKFSIIVDLAGVSRSRLAKEICVDKSVVSRWLSGATRPSAGSLDQLTESLAGRVEGLRLSDWTLSLADFADKFAAAPMQRGVHAMFERNESEGRRQDVAFCRTFDGIHLAVAGIGTGRVLVKAPNWLTHIDYDLASPAWGPTIERLAQSFRFVRYDARGNGLSDRSVGAADFATAVRDLAAVIDWIGDDKVSILGLSQGAATAAAYAAENPGRVECLFLHGGYARGRHRRGDDMDIKKSALIESLIVTGWGNDSPVYLNALASLFTPGASPDQIRSFGQLQRVSASAESVLQMKRAMDDIDIRQRLGEIRARTFVTHSRRDQIVMLEEGRLLAAGIPGAKFTTLESDNHVVLPGERAWEHWMSVIERSPAVLGSSESGPNRPVG